MLVRILSLYLQSLLATTAIVMFIGIVWVMLRTVGQKKKIPKARQAALYEMLLVAVMVIPILSFAMMGLILMVRV